MRRGTHLGDNASRSNGASIPNRHAWKNGYPPCKPTILANGDEATQFWAVGAIAQFWIKGVSAAV